ncbi:hypothetical protein CHS0354_008246 [Potamilus streckersoni]|uniref:FLYWCH-type domain-containing protein n=1 Tax=Potamilus streckersoni TaxID=2493646 RepID=A0AAE0W783_9BIVA|nr:hypothetical protein CHS0354_008246 [Potamilus streckersoni]
MDRKIIALSNLCIYTNAPRSRETIFNHHVDKCCKQERLRQEKKNTEIPPTLYPMVSLTQTSEHRKRAGVTYWWCSVNSKKMRCPATITQSENCYERGKHRHVHSIDPGIVLKVKVSSEISCMSTKSCVSFSGDGATILLVEHIAPAFARIKEQSVEIPQLYIWVDYVESTWVTHTTFPDES